MLRRATPQHDKNRTLPSVFLSVASFFTELFPTSSVSITDGANRRHRLASNHYGQRFEERMDSRWNWFIDNVPVRVALNTIVWCLWIAATVGILEFAAKF
jgi:hypothetical protein